MAERVLLQPPEIVEVEGRVVFIAGPIQDAPNWQAKGIDMLHELDSGTVIASPRKDYAPGTFVYEGQVDWETHYLKRAADFGAVMFWLAKHAQVSERAYAQTSRFELGEWFARHQYDGINLVVGIEEGFGNERYIRRRFGQDAPHITIHRTLAETCRATVELMDRVYGGA